MISTETPEFKCVMDKIATLDGTNDVDVLFDTRRTAQNGVYTLILETLTDTVSAGLAVSTLTSFVTPSETSTKGYIDATETTKWTTDASSELFADTSLDISTIGDTAHYSITQGYVNNNLTTTIIHQTGDGITVRLTGGAGDDGTIAVRLRIR